MLSMEGAARSASYVRAGELRERRRREVACDDGGGFSPVALDHALHPRHFGPAQQCDGHVRITGPCGDTMEFWVTLREASIERVSFVTDGCGASRACGSMAVTLAEGRLLDQALTLEQAEILDALGGIPAESEHCALLAATTLRAACRECLPHQAGGHAEVLTGEISREEGS
jgi:nitrogen fixation NifU-like protein